MRLYEFVAADPRSAGVWRQELVKGEVRVLDQPGRATALRAMQLGYSLASAVRRAHAKAGITTGSGYGYEAEAGDEYRVADVILSLPDPGGRRSQPAVMCLVVEDPWADDPDTLDRLRVFQTCATLKQILLFAATAPTCRVHRRRGAEWSVEDHDGREAVIPLVGLETSLFLSSIYEDLFPES